MGWDIKTAVYAGAFLVRSEEETPMGMSFKPDGTRMYVTGYSRKVHEYMITEPWDVLTAAYVRSVSVSADVVDPIGMAFNDVGTKMYVLDSSSTTNNRVNEYDLSEAWNVESAVYLQEYDIIEEDDVKGMFMKPDGAKMYIVGAIGDKVWEYDLGTQWDVSTSVYLQCFSVAAQDTGPSDLFMKPDGTKLYIVGEIGNDINEYDLVTPWDITTASFIQNFAVGGWEVGPSTMAFSSDGKIMYVLGCAGDDVLIFNLSTNKAIPIKS